jgi:colicin import membrane protein
MMKKIKEIQDEIHRPEHNPDVEKLRAMDEAFNAKMERLLDRLRASQAAARAKVASRLADPNTPPEERTRLEASQRWDEAREEAQQRDKAQQRAAQQLEVEKRYEEHQREAQRREAQERYEARETEPKPKRKSGRRPSIAPDQIAKGIEILRSNSKLKDKAAHKKLRDAGIDGSDSALRRLIIAPAYGISK